MNKLDIIIKNLVSEYYGLIGKDYHKDRDCHFYLLKDYCYGGEIKYTVYHEGYINEFYGKDQKVESKAQIELIKSLRSLIAEEKSKENYE